MTEISSKRKGRPSVHKDSQSRVKAWRGKQEGRRLDGYINNSASWRLQKLAKVWGCSLAAAVERLILESDEKYHEVLFPETKTADQDESEKK
jgi:hypothetical protein